MGAPYVLQISFFCFDYRPALSASEFDWFRHDDEPGIPGNGIFADIVEVVLQPLVLQVGQPTDLQGDRVDYLCPILVRMFQGDGQYLFRNR
jgi:hypothetical protein